MVGFDWVMLLTGRIDMALVLTNETVPAHGRDGS
jgi:hypothetical protein